MSFGDKQVTVSAALEPADYTPGKGTANLKIRFFDSDTNTNIERVTYRVGIYYNDQLVANQMFFDKDGELDLKVQPVSGCEEQELWRCTKYEGEKDLIVPSALTSSGNNPPIITGPVFDKSGTYVLKVAIIGATNPKTQTAQDINFETNINIAQVQKFALKTTKGETPVVVKTFQDQLSNLQFSESANSLSFVMPFHWEHAEHVQLVRNQIEIPKNFAPYQNVNGFKGTVNGIPLFPKDIQFDPYSSKDTNIIHFLVTGEELQIINKQNADPHSMLVEIIPESTNVIKSSNVKFSNGYKATISYDTRYGTSKDISFTFAFFDPSGNLAKDVRYAYSVKNSSGKEFVVNAGGNPDLLGLIVPSGVDSRLVTIPSKGTYTLQLILTGSGFLDFDPFVPASMQFDISETKSETVPTSVPATSQTVIPNWIRNNAKWWADGTIGDSDFVSGIQYLIKQEILKIPPTSSDPTSSTNQIPPWIKNNAKWWADGTISDDDFIKGIQFLVSKGIVRV
ncbi:MAG: peptidase [Thaumarchaeota archaeon]|nr:peptidase [Nitrososphaerota archaeon]